MTHIKGIAIIGCGARKRAEAAPAAQLYTGPYFRSCLSAAEAIAPERVFILSAWYGLLLPWEVIRPYDVTIGQPEAITKYLLAEQAAERRLLSEPILALCSARYAALLRAVWNDVSTPLAGIGGIGYQRGKLAEIRRTGLHS